LDPAHETYSPNNAMTYRNPWPRKVYNSQLQAHMGRYGVSAHSGSSRVYGTEANGSVVASNYTLVGDASRHKYHRNNVDRLKLSMSGSGLTGSVAASFNGSSGLFGSPPSQFFSGSDDNSLSFGDGSTDSAFSISAWVYMEDARPFPIIAKEDSTTNGEWALAFDQFGTLKFTIYDQPESSRQLYAYSEGNIGDGYEDQWIHVCATANAGGDPDGSNPKIMKLYINGVQVTSTLYEIGSYEAMHNTSAKIFIGKGLVVRSD
jgi:hypothetical protein